LKSRAREERAEGPFKCSPSRGTRKPCQVNDRSLVGIHRRKAGVGGESERQRPQTTRNHGSENQGASDRSQLKELVSRPCRRLARLCHLPSERKKNERLRTTRNNEDEGASDICRPQLNELKSRPCRPRSHSPSSSPFALERPESARFPPGPLPNSNQPIANPASSPRSIGWQPSTCTSWALEQH
jgi:hypothetical protein